MHNPIRISIELDITKVEIVSPEKFGPKNAVYPYPYYENWQGTGVTVYRITIKDRDIIDVSKTMVGMHPFPSSWKIDHLTGIQTNIHNNITYGNGPDKYFDIVRKELNYYNLI
jgi:hypothetical protein